MNKNKILRVIGLIAIIPMLAFFLTSGRSKDEGGKKGPDSEKKGDGGGPKIELKKMNLSLIQTFPTPPNRGPWPCPSGQNLWSGDPNATSLYDNYTVKYYCLVHVICTQFNYDETFRWENNSGTDGMMLINVPTNGSFTILVEYYEPCGSQWANGVAGRGKWAVLSGTLGYSSGIVLSQWYFSNKENC